MLGEYTYKIHRLVWCMTPAQIPPKSLPSQKRNFSALSCMLGCWVYLPHTLI